MVTEIEKFIKSGFALTVLLYMKSAFNHTSVKSICQGAREHEVSDTMEMGILCLLCSRKVVAECKQHRREVWLGKGCPQGEVSLEHMQTK